MFCIKCGKQLDDTFKFCCFCGAEVDVNLFLTHSDDVSEREVTREIVTNFDFNEKIKNASVGSIVEYGRYGGVPLEWRVIDDGDHKKLLITKCGIKLPGIIEKDWINSQLRLKLNSVFLKETFSENEISVIENFQHNVVVDGSGRNACIEDKVFVLTKREVEHYFPQNIDRCCVVVENDKEKVWTVMINEKKYCEWLLLPYATAYKVKGIYGSQNMTAGVFVDKGCVSADGTFKNISSIYSVAVRPVIWVKYL